LTVHVIKNIQGFFVAPNYQRVKTYFSFVDFMDGLSGNYQPKKIGCQKMQQKQGEEKLIIVFV
jgi:hypothetical protein